jgi:hypothetical protein
MKAYFLEVHMVGVLDHLRGLPSTANWHSFADLIRHWYRSGNLIANLSIPKPLDDAVSARGGMKRWNGIEHLPLARSALPVRSPCEHIDEPDRPQTETFAYR